MKHICRIDLHVHKKGSMIRVACSENVPLGSAVVAMETCVKQEFLEFYKHILILYPSLIPMQAHAYNAYIMLVLSLL